MNRSYLCVLSLLLVPACGPKKKDAAQPKKPVEIAVPAPAVAEQPTIAQVQMPVEETMIVTPEQVAQPESLDDAEARAYQNERMEAELQQELAIK